MKKGGVFVGGVYLSAYICSERSKFWQKLNIFDEPCSFFNEGFYRFKILLFLQV